MTSDSIPVYTLSDSPKRVLRASDLHTTHFADLLTQENRDALQTLRDQLDHE